MSKEIKDRQKDLRNALSEREQRKVTQGDIAKRLGVSPSSIGAWENGVPVPPSRITSLCKEYNVRREWLETGVGEMFEPEKTREQQLDDAIDLLFNGLKPELQRAFVRVARKHCGMSAKDVAALLDEIDEEEKKLNEIKKKNLR